MYDDKSFLASMMPVIVIAPNGDKYDSRTEYRFEELLDMVKQDHTHNKLAIATRDWNNGMYKPDFCLERNVDGSYLLDFIDVKGKDWDKDWKAQRLANNVQKEINSAHKLHGGTYRSFCLVYPDHIQYYDNSTSGDRGKPAWMYLCPVCHRFEIKPDDAPGCDCGHHFEDSDRVPSDWIQHVINNADQSHERILTPFEQSCKKRIAELGKDAKIRFLDKEKRFSVVHPDHRDELLRPDFAYEVQALCNKTKGTASRLQSLIFCIEDKEANEHIVRYLAMHAANRESYVGQIVIASRDGIKVVERDSERLRDGGAYHCPKCGRGFFAAHDDNACPFCGATPDPVK